MEDSDVINDYYDCLIECDDDPGNMQTNLSGDFKRIGCQMI